MSVYKLIDQYKTDSLDDSTFQEIIRFIDALDPIYKVFIKNNNSLISYNPLQLIKYSFIKRGTDEDNTFDIFTDTKNGTFLQYKNSARNGINIGLSLINLIPDSNPIVDDGIKRNVTALEKIELSPNKIFLNDFSIDNKMLMKKNGGVTLTRPLNINKLVLLSESEEINTGAIPELVFSPQQTVYSNELDDHIRVSNGEDCILGFGYKITYSNPDVKGYETLEFANEETAYNKNVKNTNKYYLCKNSKDPERLGKYIFYATEEIDEVNRSYTVEDENGNTHTVSRGSVIGFDIPKENYEYEFVETSNDSPAGVRYDKSKSKFFIIANYITEGELLSEAPVAIKEE